MTRTCPTFIVSAPASNQGKTTVTAGLAYYHRKQGRVVRIFKTGPDFLDPMILETASGNPVHQLDLWMTGETDCRQLLYEAAGEADIILVEGVMGLFDGDPSTADLAQKFNLPVVAVINASAMAQTFHAVAHGLATFRPAINFAGAIANSVASLRHQQMLSSQAPSNWQFFGCLTRNELMAFPDRHLGLVQAQEINDLELRLEMIAQSLAETALANFLPDVQFDAVTQEALPQLLTGQIIGVARDAAFSFLYPANLETLQRLGATLAYFSPLTDTALPKCDSLYFPGGYPELYLEILERNQSMKDDLYHHFKLDKPIYAECGGMLYLLDSLTDKSGNSGAMAGIISGNAIMQKKLAGLGFQSAVFPNGILRGHTFHHSLVKTAMSPTAHAKRSYDGADGEAIFHIGNLWASYLHLYFRSNPSLIAELFLGESDISNND